jgi:hypothetical protein
MRSPFAPRVSFSQVRGGYGPVVTDLERFLDHSRELELERRIDQLEEALQTRSAIARAQGMLMERYGVGEDRAIALMKRISSQTNTKVRDLAQEVLAGASLDDLRASGLPSAGRGRHRNLKTPP